MTNKKETKYWLPDCFKEQNNRFVNIDKYSSQIPINEYIEEFLGGWTKKHTISEFIDRTDNLWKDLLPFSKKPINMISSSYFYEEDRIEQIFCYCDNFILIFNMGNGVYSTVLYLNNKSPKGIYESLINNLIWESKDAKKKFINILIEKGGGLDLHSLETEVPKFIPENYHKIENAWENIKTLLSDSTKGIILLHGEPGTGKTSFIRSLSKEIDKKFIFVPPQFVRSLVEPDFLRFMMKHKDSILILEDAESVLKTRESGENHSVSNLLNLTDGLLSDLLNIKIICTLNCNVKLIDSAIRRPGRLLFEHEFKKLEIHESNSKLSELFPNKGYWAIKPMTISEIYNYESFKNEEQTKAIGFNK